METKDILVNEITDKSQMAPLNQKRMLAFVNHFLINSCSFLNEFAEKCEMKFIEVERKLQKVESALTIIEAKLASVPDTEETAKSNKEDVTKNEESKTTVEESEKPKDEEAVVSTEDKEVKGVKANEDIRYKKYFKMILVGVPVNAVKLKISMEGLNPDILDTPNAILPDGIKEDS